MPGAACPVDGKPVDPDTDHAGRAHGGARRRYCTLECRRVAELDRRQQARAARRLEAERLEREQLVAEARERERVEPPLPGMPAHPLLAEAG